MVCWRRSAAALLGDTGHEVSAIRAASTVGALMTLAATPPAAVRRFMPDVVWSQAVRLPRTAAPQAVHYRDIGSFTDLHPRTARLRTKARAEARDLARSDLVIANSETLRNAMLQRHATLDPQKVTVVHNGLDLEDFASAPRSTPSSQRPLRLLLPQSDAPHKRNDLAADVLHHLVIDPPSPFESVHLDVLGAGTYADLLARARELGIESAVSLHGYRTRARVANAYRAADVILITSAGESFCNPIIEAHAVGRSIVSADFAVARELAGPASIITPPRAVSMAAAVRDAVSAPGPDAVACRDHAERFDSSVQSDRLRTELRGLLDARAPR